MTLVLDPEHGEVLHLLRPCVNRCEPRVGDQVVWKSVCGAVILATVKGSVEGAKRLCKRCVPERAR